MVKIFLYSLFLTLSSNSLISNDLEINKKLICNVGVVVFEVNLASEDSWVVYKTKLYGMQVKGKTDVKYKINKMNILDESIYEIFWRDGHYRKIFLNTDTLKVQFAPIGNGECLIL
tara:strand:- start:486 stop:833 length:348 start_codon:yes stop_codon:yes gene_type:complete